MPDIYFPDASWYGVQGTESPDLNTTFASLVSEQQELNRLQMEREDTAYQRMVEDMRKAGLNPWTGISSGGANSSSFVSPRSSALERVMAILEYNQKTSSENNKQILSAINTGIKVALPFLALLGA